LKVYTNIPSDIDSIRIDAYSCYYSYLNHQIIVYRWEYNKLLYLARLSFMTVSFKFYQ